jgi:pimeloyl-ACP methyl ester carboxylesterase
MKTQTLFTYKSGDQHSPAIVFLHGGGLSGKSWLPVMDRMSEFHCLAPDLPEQGSSRAIPYSIERCVVEVGRIIQEKTAARKAHLVALSLGGPVALRLAGTHPELVETVLISGSSGQIPRWLVKISKSSLWTYRLFSPDYLIRQTMHQQGIPVQYAGLVEDDLRQSLDLAFLRHFMDELAAWQLPPRIARPLLLLVGEKESRAARRFALQYLRNYPGAVGRIVPAAKHAWSLQFPDEFADVIRAWISGQTLPDGLKILSE